MKINAYFQSPSEDERRYIISIPLESEECSLFFYKSTGTNAGKMKGCWYPFVCWNKKHIFKFVTKQLYIPWKQKLMDKMDIKKKEQEYLGFFKYWKQLQMSLQIKDNVTPLSDSVIDFIRTHFWENDEFIASDSPLSTTTYVIEYTQVYSDQHETFFQKYIDLHENVIGQYKTYYATREIPVPVQIKQQNRLMTIPRVRNDYLHCLYPLDFSKYCLSVQHIHEEKIEPLIANFIHHAKKNSPAVIVEFLRQNQNQNKTTTVKPVTKLLRELSISSAKGKQVKKEEPKTKPKTNEKVELRRSSRLREKKQKGGLKTKETYYFCTVVERLLS